MARISGRIMTRPMKAPMAMGTERSRAPMPRARTARRVRPAALPARARRTPGSPREADWSVPERKDWARGKVSRFVARVRGRATAARTAALDQRTGRRRGTAVMVARIWPVEYSPAVARMPSTPRLIWANWVPSRTKTTVSMPPSPVPS
jgi:hypothetical protein